MRSCHRCLLVATPYSGTIPIQNIVLLPTSTSYLRTKASLPSVPMRNTDRHAGTFRTCAPSRTSRPDMRRHHQEGAAVDAVRLGVIDQRWLASLLVDQIGRQGVFAADKDFLASTPSWCRRDWRSTRSGRSRNVHGARGLP